MAEKILIMGESGTGKSASMRNCKPEEIAVINPVGKPLPFRGTFDMLNGITDSERIIEWIKAAVNRGKKIIVIDDFQYILSIPYMNRIKEAGWDKWNDFGANYFDIIDVCKDLPDDVNVYYFTHTETLENGITTIKLIGKMLREKITIEGLFTTVLRTQVIDGKYYFLTQNSGKDTVKSPIGMFGSYAIENDLKYVDDKIRNYYQIGDFKSDEEIAKADAENEKTDVEKASNGRMRRTTRNARSAMDDAIKAADAGTVADENLPFTFPEEGTWTPGAGKEDDSIPQITEEKVSTPPTIEEPTPTRRTRKTRN